MRILRVALTVIAFLGVLTVLFIGALYGLVTPECVAERLTSTLEDRFGLRLRMEGLPTVRPLPGFRIELGRSVITDAASGDVVLRWDAASLRLHPFAIFTKSPRIDEIILTAPETDLTPEGRNPFDRKSATLWNVDHLRVTQGRIRIAWGSGAEAELTDLSGTLSDLSETGAATELTGTLNAPNAQGTVTLGTVLDWRHPNSIATAALQLTFKGLADRHQTDLTLSTQALRWEEGALRLTSPNLLLLNESERLLRLKASDAVRSPEGLWKAAKLSATTELKRREGDLSLTLSAPEASGRKGSLPDLPNFTLESRLRVSDGTGDTLEGRLTGSATPEHLSFAGLFLGVPVTFKGSPLDEARPTLTGDLTLGRLPAALITRLHWIPEHLTDLNFIGTFRISEGALPGLPSGLSGEAHLSGGALSLGPVRGKWMEGSADLAAHLAASGEWSLSLRAHDADAGLFFRERTKTPPVTGRLRADASASGNLTQGTLHTFSISGEVRNGTLTGLDLPAARRLLLEEQPDDIPSEILRNANTPFDALDWTSTREADGSVHTEARLRAPGLTGKLSGETSGMPLSLHAEFLFAADEELGELPLSADLKLGGEDSVRWFVAWTPALERVRREKGDTGFSLKRLKRQFERSFREWTEGMTLPDWKLPELPTLPWGDEKAEPSPSV